MPITLTELKARLESPKNRGQVEKAKSHENALKFHGVPTLSKEECLEAYNDYMKWVRAVMRGKKVDTHEALFSFPVKTVSSMQEVVSVYSKVFEARDQVFSYEFASKDKQQRWMQYRKDKKLQNIWKEYAMEVLRGAINSILVIDLPREQNKTGDPQPYPVLLDVSNVVEFEMADKCQFEWLAFTNSKEELAVYDDQYYTIYAYKDKQVGEVISQNPHQLGECPCRLYWNIQLDEKKPFIKESPWTNELGQLRWFLFFSIGKRHVNLYAGNPIISIYGSDCTYEKISENGADREICADGTLVNQLNEPIFYNGRLKPCPKCSNEALHGPGSVVKIRRPRRGQNEMADIPTPITITGIDRSSLDYNVEEENRLWEVIFTNLCGNALPPDDQAVNIPQVMSLMQGRESKIAMIQKPIEDAQKWAESIMCRLMFGANFRGAFISLGKEKYLWTAEELLNYYNSQKAAGASDVTLDLLLNQYYNTKYRNNPDQLMRVQVLSNVEPFKHLSKAEVMELPNEMVTREDRLIKLYFSELVARFERENISISDFAKGQSLDAKVKIIKEAFISYLPEQEPQPQPQPAAAPSA